MNRNRRTMTVAAVVAGALSFVGSVSATQTDQYPSRPIRLVVPFSPGGATDIIARVIGQKLSEQIGQPVVVENKAGANGNIAADFVAKSPSDGYTLLYNTSSIALSPALYKKLNHDVTKDFEPIILTSIVPLLLTVHPSVPASNITEFIELLKARPDSMFYGSAGLGNITHLGSFLFLQEQQLKANHIPYKGSSPSVVATVAQEVTFNMEPINVSLPFVRDNRLRALAVSTKARATVLPDIPTLDESVLPGFQMGAWQGIMAPANTPKKIVTYLNAQISQALTSEEVRAKLVAQGAEMLGSTPEEYKRYLESEVQRWDKVIKDSGIQPD